MQKKGNNDAIEPRDPVGKICSFYLCHAIPTRHYIKKRNFNQCFLVCDLLPACHLVTHISVLAGNSHITFTIADVLAEAIQLFTTII